MLRKVLYWFFKGEKHQCTVCGSRLDRFLGLKNGEIICPACGSNARTRRLYALLKEKFLEKGFKILDFSPSRGVFHQLKKRRDIEYFSTDFVGEFISDYHFDIRNIAMPDESFDLVVCYHVLEHIEDDRRAMAELFRVLKRGGVALVQTPFREGDVFEDARLTRPEERLAAFGQADHVRVYSVDGLKERLEKTGFSVEVLSFYEEEGSFLGFKKRKICAGV